MEAVKQCVVVREEQKKTTTGKSKGNGRMLPKLFCKGNANLS